MLAPLTLPGCWSASGIASRLRSGPNSAYCPEQHIKELRGEHASELRGRDMQLEKMRARLERGLAEVEEWRRVASEGELHRRRASEVGPLPPFAASLLSQLRLLRVHAVCPAARGCEGASELLEAETDVETFMCRVLAAGPEAFAHARAPGGGGTARGCGGAGGNARASAAAAAARAASRLAQA